MLANGQGLYYDLNRYPFTVAAYGPIFYSSVAALHVLGLPLHQSGRLISFSALLTALWLAWRILTLLVTDRRAAVAGVALAGASANLLFWSTTGQTDMLACCFALAGFLQFLVWRGQRSTRRLVLSGLFVLLAVFTKQTALAAGAAIAVSLVVIDPKRALYWISGVAGTGSAVLLMLHVATHGHFFQDAVLANMNPFWDVRLRQHLQYFLTVNSGLLVFFLATLRRTSRQFAPLYVYAVLAALMWLVTAPKIGSDLNYQMEVVLVLSLCCACGLDHLEFFHSVRTQSWIPLLQAPLLLFLIVNLSLTVKTLRDRVSLEAVRQEEQAELAPFLARKGSRVISMQFDPLLTAQGNIEVEPLIYTLLVNAGRVNTAPVRNDLAARRFATVILFNDVFSPRTPLWQNPETPSLPASELDEIRKHYRLVKHVPGPYLDGDYVYQPL